MVEILTSRGFNYSGSCNCHGGNTKWYENPNFPGLRMEVSTAGFWVKQKVNMNWQTIDFGSVGSFEEKLNKYFTK